MAEQLIQRAALAIIGEPGVLDVALDQRLQLVQPGPATCRNTGWAVPSARYTPSTNSMWKCTLGFSADRNRCTRVTAPVWPLARATPAL
jgi:hypothetical protein